MADFTHIPVLLKECIDGLNVKDGGIYFDGTLGGGGHSYEILKKSAPNGRLVATDLDDYAISRASESLKEFNGRFEIVKDNFKNFLSIKERLGIEKFDGILLDLGVSSFQLDDRERGFSYLDSSVKLDMRMNKGSHLTAEIVVNEYKEEELKKIFFEYGEEKFSGLIAKNIVKFRQNKRILTVGDLNEIIFSSIPKKFQHNGHPSKRVFQALRIEVNGELEGLYNVLLDMGLSLKSGGRIAVISFHSLEDRIVKKAFKELECDCICDKSLPVCVCGRSKKVDIITKHPIVASEEELKINSRSASAKLRIAQRV